MPHLLDTPLERLVGARTAHALAPLGLHTAGDLLRHYPRRYDERGVLTPLRDLQVGDHVTVQAEVVTATTRTTQNGRQLTEVVVTDGSGRLRLTFFGRATWRARELVAGRSGLFAGTVTQFRGVRQLTHPEYQLGGEDAEELTRPIIPVYPARTGLPSWNIAKAVRTVLDAVQWPPDPLPEQVRAHEGLLGLVEAFRGIHRPADRAEAARARRRLAFDEAFGLQVVLAQRRVAAQALPAVPRPARQDGLLAAFDAALPFPLTAGQATVGQELAAELARPHPMYRLLQGEVGSGKTLVALRAMLAVVDAGGQAALLAPTEVLAHQHLTSLRGLLGPLGAAGELAAAPQATQVVLLTGSQTAAARREALAAAASGAAGIVVGTHALLGADVAFADLGLVVVDEQHRFGVEQRDALRAKGQQPPHVLVMTATPIPRTVAITVYGDLSVSTLTELPSGRAPVRTAVVPLVEHPAWIETAWQRVREHVAAGRQAFVVCPRIGGQDDPEDEGRPGTGVVELTGQLRSGPLAGLRLEALHGRLPAEEREAVMRRFAAGQVDVLVATTVIEVGVDVPNATVMVVLDADRFGVSQLHQLRGRVGRGGEPGLCLLVTQVPDGPPARERLDAVAATTDGFALAQLDLQQRREGDVLGASQSGRRSSLRLLQLQRDGEIIQAARAAATAVVAADPDLSGHPALASAVAELVDAEQAAYLEKA